MRRLIFLTLLCLCLPVQAAVTLVSGQTSAVVDDHWASSSSSAAQTLPVAATAGNLIVVAVSISTGAIETISVTGIDDAGTTSYSCAHTQATSSGLAVAICWGIAAGANAGTGVVVTISTTSPSTDDVIALMEFAGTDGTQASLSTDGDNISGQTTHETGPVTPGVADNVIVGMSRGAGREWTVDADFTAVLDNNRGTIAYMIQSANTAQAYTITSDIAGDSSMAVVAFKGAAGGGGSSSVPAIYRHLRQMKQ